MLNDKKKYFCCGLPYQLAIKEGLLFREQVEDEMSEADFDATSFSMEMGALWLGDSDDAFFKFDDISPRRKLKHSYFPLEIYKAHRIKIPPLALNERRILSVDVALMASKNITMMRRLSSSTRRFQQNVATIFPISSILRLMKA